MFKNKASFFTISRINNRYIYASVAVALFLIPNLVFLVPGLYGVYLTNLIWLMLSLILVPLVSHRGFGSLGVRDAIYIGLTLVIALTVLGFFLGFYYRRSSPQSLLIDLTLLATRISAAEVARASIMAVMPGNALKLVAGTTMGFFFGSTLLSSRFVELLTPHGGLISSVPQIIYSVLITEIHILGGLYPAMVFRFIVDGYWEISPYTSNIFSLGVVSPVILSFMYIFAMILMPDYERIRGSSEKIFKKSLRKIFSIAADIFTLAIVVLLTYSLYMGIVPLVIISGSMEPTLDIGDIALVMKVRNPSEVGVGDIVAFWNENQIVVHRIVGIEEEGFRTKGDAYAAPDPFIVSRDLVIGKVIGSIPKIGWITIILRSTPEGLKNIALNIYRVITYDSMLMVIVTSIVIITSVALIIYRRIYRLL